MNPAKSHYLTPNRDYAYCGLTLAPADDWLIDSGYDAFYWVVVDERVESNWCKDCTRWKAKWASADPVLPRDDSPVTPSEWKSTVGADSRRRKAALDMMADTVVRWFGEGAERT